MAIKMIYYAQRYSAWEPLFGIFFFTFGGGTFAAIGFISKESVYIYISIGGFLASSILFTVPIIKTYIHRHDKIKSYYRTPKMHQRIKAKIIQIDPHLNQGGKDE